MREAENREFVRGLYAAVAEGNVGPLFAAMDEDFVTYEAESLPFGGAHRGLAARSGAEHTAHRRSWIQHAHR